MKNSKSITITTALAVLVIALFTGIPFSDASQTLIKHGAKGKHKHAAHKLAVKHGNLPSQTLAKSETEKELGDTPIKDSLWFLEHEDPATGTIPTGLYNTWYNHDHALTYDGRDGMLNTTGTPIDTVACLGPFYHYGWGDVGGRTRALLISSASDNIMFAGGVSGGLWKSTTAGSNWTPVNDTAACLNVSCITQSPFNSNVIYYGTGETVGIGNGNGGAGVFKSTNGVTTFQQLSATTSFYQSWAIEHDKTDSLTVYYGTAYNGLQRTTDGGTTWNIAPGTAGPVCDIVTFPSAGFNDNVLIAKYDSGLYMATNGKTGSFTKISSTAFPAAGNFYRIKLANCKNYPNVVYAAFAAPSNDWWGAHLSGFCKSSDRGVTWTALTIPDWFTGGDWPMMLAVNPLDSNKLVIGGTGCKASSNGGGTWYASLGYHGDYHALVSYSGSHELLLAGDGGIEHYNWDSLSSTGQYTYRLNHNYVVTQFTGGDFASSGRKCMGGTFDQGSWVMGVDSFPNYNNNVAGGDGLDARISQQDSNLGYTMDQNLGIQRHTRLFVPGYGGGWDGRGPNTGQGVNWAPDYQINHADGLQLYYPTQMGLWRTIDTGYSWTQLNTTTIAGITRIGVTNATNPAVYFDGHIGTTGHFYRIDNAKTFTPGTPVDLSASLPNGDYMGEITPYPPNPSTLFIGSTNYTSNPRAYKVMNANTATPHWVNITGNLPAYVGVNQIQADPDDTTSLLAATSFGLYYSGDMGAHWYKESRIPNVVINQMPLRASDRKLFLFTPGRGVWYCSLRAPSSKRTTPIAPVTETTEQLQFSLYPDPATEKLTVSPEQALSSSARIAIYSSDGRMISESAWNPTGGEGQEVNISSLPSGAYFLQITDGNKIAKNKFVKM